MSVKTRKKINSFQKSVLVTGGAGFIGSHVVRELVKSGVKVIVPIKATTDLYRLKNIRANIIFPKVDITDLPSLKAMIQKEEPTGIFHLAASNIMSGATASDEEVLRTNVLGTENLLIASRDIPYEFFIYTGSFLEYGPLKGGFVESKKCAPEEFYSITKLAATLAVTAEARRYGKPTLVFRVFTPYGPSIQKGRLMYELVNKSINNDEIRLSRPEVVRDFVFIDDLLSLLFKGAKNARKYAGEIFNAGSGQAVTLKELSRLVLKLTSSSSEITWSDNKLSSYDKTLWKADMKKSMKAFGWHSRFSIEQGLKKTVQQMLIDKHEKK